MKHQQVQAKLGSEINYLENSGNDQECGERPYSIETKHQSNKLNNSIGWIKTKGKIEAGD